MKKKNVQLLIAGSCMMMLLAVGCGQASKTQNNSSSTTKEATQTEAVENSKDKDTAKTKKETKKEKKEEKKDKTISESKDTKKTNGVKTEIKATDKKEEKKTEEKSEKHKMEGKLAEKKDTMFVIEDSNKKASAFAFQTKPEGYDNLKVNDEVVVEYTGEVSETEAFTGEVLSITKSETKK